VVDSSLVGRQIAEVTFVVERSKVRELARSLGDDDPVWHDAAAAAAAGFESVPMLPTMVVLADHWRSGGVGELMAAIRADPALVLHGEAAWEYLAPVDLGDTLTMRQKVANVTRTTGRRGGAMTIIRLESEFENDRGELVVRRTDTLVQREGASG
jgi:acyl dehydratase